jgi:hypothetical protein
MKTILALLVAIAMIIPGAAHACDPIAICKGKVTPEFHPSPSFPHAASRISSAATSAQQHMSTQWLISGSLIASSGSSAASIIRTSSRCSNGAPLVAP